MPQVKATGEMYSTVLNKTLLFKNTILSRIIVWELQISRPLLVPSPEVPKLL
jgi:hypothetical protein